MYINISHLHTLYLGVFYIPIQNHPNIPLLKFYIFYRVGGYIVTYRPSTRAICRYLWAISRYLRAICRAFKRYM